MAAASEHRWRASERTTDRLPRSVSAARARHILILGAAVLSIGVAACGQQAHPTAADANNNGFYVDAGKITYQLQISRELNPYSIEDKGYLVGVTAPAPAPDELWFGVFLWAKNQGNSAATTATTFDIVDTQGNVYYPVAVNTQVNPYAWTPTTLQPLATYPTPGSTAYFGPTQGALLLFKLNTSAYANRPLSLQIHAPGQAHPSTISLDL